MKRIARVNRATKETNIECVLTLEGAGRCRVETGIGFFDHMLELFSFYANIDLELSVNGDLLVDGHHTVEDIGLVLGESFKSALGDKVGINRYGSMYLPMDETLARIVLDFSNRPYLVYRCDFMRTDLGTLDVQNIKEFFKSFSVMAGLTLHIDVLYGENDHHKAEAIFKGFGHAIREAIKVNSKQLMSTKGVL